MNNNQFLLCREIKMYNSDSSLTDIVDFTVKYEYDEILWSFTLDLETFNSMTRLDNLKSRILFSTTECKNKNIRFSILIRLDPDIQCHEIDNYILLKDILMFVAEIKPCTLWTEITERNLAIIKDINPLTIKNSGTKSGLILGQNIINHFCVKSHSGLNTILDEFKPDKVCLSFFESKTAVPKEMLKAFNELRVCSSKIGEYELFVGIHGDFTSAASNSLTEIKFKSELCRILNFKKFICNLPLNSDSSLQSNLPTDSYADSPLENCFGELLIDIKSILKISDFVKLENTYEAGVRVLTKSGTISPCSFAEAIERYGIPVNFKESRIIAASGNSFCDISDDEITSILSGGILIDSFALKELTDRGFGKYLGVKSESVFNTLQKAIGPEEYSASIRNGVMQDYIGSYFLSSKSNDWSSNVSILSPLQNAQILSWIVDPDRNRVFPASVSYENSLGGRVISYAYDFANDFFVGFYSWGRGKQIADYLYWLSRGDDFVRCLNAPNMLVHMEKTKEFIQLSLLNLSIDKSEKLNFEINKNFISKLEILDKSTNAWLDGIFSLSENECGSLNIETEIILTGLESTTLRIYSGGK